MADSSGINKEISKCKHLQNMITVAMLVKNQCLRRNGDYFRITGPH